MSIKHTFPRLHALSAATSLLAIGASIQAADNPTLKDAYKDHFYVGVAINRTIAMGDSVRADNVNRNREHVDKDIVLVKEQFNQISPENDLKWALIHPQEAARTDMISGLRRTHTSTLA